MLGAQQHCKALCSHSRRWHASRKARVFPNVPAEQQRHAGAGKPAQGAEWDKGRELNGAGEGKIGRRWGQIRNRRGVDSAVPVRAESFPAWLNINLAPTILVAQVHIDPF